MRKLKVISVAIFLCGSLSVAAMGCNDGSADRTKSGDQGASGSSSSGTGSPQGPSGPPSEQKSGTTRSK